MVIKVVAKNVIHEKFLLTKPFFVVSKATGWKYWIRRDSIYTTKNAIYLAYCTKYWEQGAGFIVSWKPRLSNYKSHIKQSVLLAKE